jgi:hypothetical protein
MFGGGFKESEEQLASLPDEKPAVFSLFLEWLCKNRLAKFDLADSTVSKFPERLISLFAYFARFNAPLNDSGLQGHSKRALKLAKHLGTP